MQCFPSIFYFFVPLNTQYATLLQSKCARVPLPPQKFIEECKNFFLFVIRDKKSHYFLFNSAYLKGVCPQRTIHPRSAYELPLSIFFCFFVNQSSILERASFGFTFLSFSFLFRFFFVLKTSFVLIVTDI